MGELILGAILQYMVSALSGFFMVGKGLTHLWEHMHVPNNSIPA